MNELDKIKTFNPKHLDYKKRLKKILVNAFILIRILKTKYLLFLNSFLELKKI